jgi:hypothetical protein
MEKWIVQQKRLKWKIENTIKEFKEEKKESLEGNKVTVQVCV